MLRGLQRALIYFPDRRPPPPAAAVLPGARDVVLRTSDGLRLGAWHVSAYTPPLGVTVLIANGNAGERSGRAPLAYALAQRGCDVLLFDYRGYGGNPGRPSEPGLALDARAARGFLADEMGVPAERMIYLGESLGAAVVAELATEHPPAGLALRSPFHSLAAVGKKHYPLLPVGALLLDRYPVAEHVARVDVPTVVVYGTADAIVPAHQSEEVAEAAAGPTTVVAVGGADHNDPELAHGPQLIDAVARLAGRLRSDL